LLNDPTASVKKERSSQYVFTYHQLICGRIVADENCKEPRRGDKLAYG
jgi:hypothetical protein